MKPSLIVYDVPNGKTRFAERIAKFYGLKITEFDNMVVWNHEHIYFTNEKPKRPFDIFAKSFREVADEINAAIPLVTFQSGESPTIVGEYDVFSFGESKFYRRWWHGDRWSFALLSNSQEQKNVLASELQDLLWRPMWRGLSEEPIVID